MEDKESNTFKQTSMEDSVDSAVDIRPFSSLFLFLMNQPLPLIFIPSLNQSRCVEEQKLCVFDGLDTKNAGSCGVPLGTHGTDGLTDDVVDQCTFA